MPMLFWSPVRFFETRRAGGLHWLAAAGALALCAGLQAAYGWMVAGKSALAMDGAFDEIDLPFSEFPVQGFAVFAGLLGYPMFFGMMVLAVLALDVVASGSEQPRLLARFTAVSFYTQAPWCVLMLAVAWFWTPEPLSLPVGASQSEILEQVGRYQTTIRSDPLLSTGFLLERFSLIWLSAVLAIALKVVGSLSVRATVAAGTVLYVICMAGPILNLVREALR